MTNLKLKLRIQNLSSWISHNRIEFLLLVFIILVAGFLRFYRIDEYLTFLGDEGRDARVVRNLIVNFDPVLIGPMTSVSTSAGNMYLGPLYYYLMAPAMLLWGVSPVGPAVMVGVLSLATMVLMWWLARKWWHPVAGLVAVALYAVSPTVIFYSRSSWNPNVMPLFSLVSMWAIWEIWSNSNLTKSYKLQAKSWIWFVLLGISMAFVLQSHYLGLILFPIVGLFWLLSIPPLLKGRLGVVSFKKNKYLRKYILYSGFGILVFLFLMSPLLIFDLRHDWLNFNAFKAFFTERQTSVHFKFFDELHKFYPILEQIYESLLTVGNQMWARVIIFLTGIVVIASNISFKRSNPDGIKTHSSKSIRIASSHQLLNKAGKMLLAMTGNPLFMLLIWLLFGVLGLVIYQQHIYDHYFGFLFVVPFMLTGWVVWRISKYLGKFKWLIFIAIGTLMIYIIRVHGPFNQKPNRQLQKTTAIGEKIISESGGQPFNLALISKHNYDEGYRFVLEKENAKLVEIDPLNADETITEQLFVICENQPPFGNREEDCNPIAHPRAEIALFGWAEVKEEWEFEWGHKLFKLIKFDGS